jgi:phage baseplate assembly protein gpV
MSLNNRDEQILYLIEQGVSADMALDHVYVGNTPPQDAVEGQQWLDEDYNVFRYDADHARWVKEAYGP